MYGLEYGGNGFGGFDMNADHGDTGGGFMDSGNPKSAEKKSRDRQTLLPVTIKQLYGAGNDGESFKIEEIELYTVKIIGTVESIQQHSTHIIYNVNDGSGVMECKEWIDKGASSTSNIKENSCVRVFGSLREYEGRKHILLFSISTLQDWNEQTNHLLEVVYTHLQITRGPIPGTESAGVNLTSMSSYQKGGAFMATPGAGGYSNVPVTIKQDNSMIDQVKYIMQQIASPEGARISLILSRLQQQGVHMNMPDLKKLLNQCIENGTMYSGADDDHICSID